MAKKNVTNHEEVTVDEVESLKEELEALEKFYATRKDEINTKLKRLEEKENMRKIAEALKNERDGLIAGGISEEEANYIMNIRLEQMLLSEKKNDRETSVMVSSRAGSLNYRDLINKVDDLLPSITTVGTSTGSNPMFN